LILFKKITWKNILLFLGILNTELKELLYSIKSIKNIPNELLSKFYARLYTAESDFEKT